MQNELTLNEEMEMANQLINDEVGYNIPRTSGPWYYLVSLKDLKFQESETQHLAEVELVPIGKWKHPDAPGGEFDATEVLLNEFIQNFKDKVVGEQLPLDFDHLKNSKATPGWIIDMKIKPNSEGGKSIFATMDVTDPETRKEIKEGSLKFISPEFWIGWENPVDGKRYNVIRAAGLTNYPFIKNMTEISILNFNEFADKIYDERREVNMTQEEEAKKAAEEAAKKVAEEEEVKKKAAEEAEAKKAVEAAEAEKVKAAEAEATRLAEEEAKKEAALQLAAVNIVDISKATDEQLKKALGQLGEELAKRKVPGYGTKAKEDANMDLTEEAKAKFNEQIDGFAKEGRISPAQAATAKKDGRLIKLCEGAEGNAFIKMLSMNAKQVEFSELTLKDDNSVKINYSELSIADKGKYLYAQAKKVSEETGQDYNKVVHELAAKLN